LLANNLKAEAKAWELRRSISNLQSSQRRESLPKTANFVQKHQAVWLGEGYMRSHYLIFVKDRELAESDKPAVLFLNWCGTRMRL
jgi:hypothetical protein